MDELLKRVCVSTDERASAGSVGGQLNSCPGRTLPEDKLNTEVFQFGGLNCIEIWWLYS